MKYKPSYGDKQREAQKQKKEQLKDKETPRSEETPSAEPGKIPEDDSKRRDKQVA
jgi:hypothetical protein